MRSSRARATGPVFEQMEPRLLLDGAVTASVVDGNLLIDGDDMSNSILLTALAQPGEYVIRGLNNAGPTTVNGSGWATVAGVTNWISIDMLSGDDVVNIGSRVGDDTVVDALMDINLGGGTNHLNIGRVLRAGRLRFGGRVDITGDVSVSNDPWGTGNVYVAGASLAGFNVDLGAGGHEKNVTLVNLLHEMDVDSDIPGFGDRDCTIDSLGVSNSLGSVDMFVRDTTVGRMSVVTAEGGDEFDLGGLVSGLALFTTAAGADHFYFDQSDTRNCDLADVMIVTSYDNDSVQMSNTYADNVYIDLGTTGFGAFQRVHLAVMGAVSLESLSVRGRALEVASNPAAGVNPTFIDGAFTVRSTGGDVRDVVDLANFYPNEVKIILGDGNDLVMARETTVDDDMVIRTGAGDDTVLLGQDMGSSLPGSNNFGELTIDTGRDNDQVAVANTHVRGAMLVWLGSSTGSQRARIGVVGSGVVAADMTIAGTGRTNVFVGQRGTPGTAVSVYGALTIFTGFDTRGDVVVLQHVSSLGSTTIFTGNGRDIVAIQNSAFSGPTVIGTGRGGDVIIVTDSFFRDNASFYGGAGSDVFYFVENDFDARAVFHGGGGTDWVNADFGLRNTFSPVPEFFSIERDF